MLTSFPGTTQGDQPRQTELKHRKRNQSGKGWAAWHGSSRVLKTTHGQRLHPGPSGDGPLVRWARNTCRISASRPGPQWRRTVGSWENCNDWGLYRNLKSRTRDVRFPVTPRTLLHDTGRSRLTPHFEMFCQPLMKLSQPNAQLAELELGSAIKEEKKILVMMQAHIHTSRTAALFEDLSVVFCCFYYFGKSFHGR